MKILCWPSIIALSIGAGLAAELDAEEQKSTKHIQEQPVFEPGLQISQERNPLLADCGCEFPNGTITANFLKLPFGYYLIKPGDDVAIITFGGACNLLTCSGGEKKLIGNLSMNVKQIDISNGSIFNFILSGNEQ